MEFLSTPSARRATQCGQLRHQLLQDFYPRPPRGGRRLAKIIGHALNAISIHALREEGDGLLYDYYTLADLFLSTPSARRATAAPGHDGLQFDFYPRPPRGGRRDRPASWHSCDRFLSTPSARRATDKSLPTRSRQRYFYPRPPRGGRPSFSLTAQKRF